MAAVILLAAGAGEAQAQQRTACESGTPPVAQVVAIGGSVTVTPLSGSETLLELGSVVCFGDRIATGESANVELRFTGANTTTGAGSNTVLVLPPSPDVRHDLTVLTGLMRFVSSVRTYFEVRTPVMNAGINGTEATVIVDGPETDSLVLVREGEITATDARSPDVTLALAGGDAAYASRRAALVAATPETVPEKFLPFLVNPVGAADWAVYYPPVLLGAEVESPLVREAAGKLAAGEPQAADALLAEAELPPSARAAALAVRSVAAVFRNDRAEGLRLAEAAVEGDPELGAAHIALSYALQAEGRVEAARDAAQAAVEASPEDAYAWARLAELELTVGDYRTARRAVDRSLALDETALARAIQGFAALSASRFQTAEEAFQRAIALDSNAPLPRLGLGLALVRRGKLSEGRAEIENAVALDPRRASLRTWLGRVYFEESLPEKASAQFEIAQDEDPDDPNAYLFSALERFAGNDPVGALREVERAEEAGEGRATLRTPAGLAEDRAARGAALARIYDSLGFGPLAILTGTEAVEQDGGNAEAHYFLSDAFLGRQGFEVTQASELLMAQILSPPGRTLIQPRLAETDLGLLQTSGPSRTTFAELSPLVVGNGFSAGFSGRGGTQDTFGAESSAAVLHGPFSLAIGQSHIETDGFLPNNFVNHDIVSLEARLQPAPELTFFGELRHRDSDFGDRVIEFGEEISQHRRQEFQRDSARLGLHYEPAPGHDLVAFGTLVNFESEDTDCDLSIPPFAAELGIERENDGFDVQGRYIGQFGDTNVTAGGSLTRLDVDGQDRFSVTPSFFGACASGAPELFGVDEPISDRFEHQGAFGYVTSEIIDGVEATVGLSFDDFERSGFSTSEVNPKVGLRVRLAPGLQVRAAYAETLKRPLVLDQTVEPTTIAGFPQFFDDVNGATAQLAGGGIDARLTRDLWVGAEATRRWIDTPVDQTETVTGDTFVTTEETRETTVSGYANLVLSDHWTVALEARHEQFRLQDDDSNLPREVDTTAVPLRLSWFGNTGFFASAEAAYVHQSMRETAGASRRKDDGLLLGAAVGYRLPDRRGVIALEGRNLLDEDLEFRDQSFNTPRPRSLNFSREFAVFLTATFALGQ